MIWTDRQRTDATLRKLVYSDSTEENVHIEEVTNNVVTNGTPINQANLNIQEKNIGTYGTDTYSNNSTYTVGDIVTYEGLLYRCTTAIETPENFNASHWEEISLLDLSEENIQDIAQNAQDIIQNTQNIALKANSSDLATVATSGSYDDLSDKPIVNSASVETTKTYSCNYINSLFGEIQYPTYTNGQDISSTRRTYYQKIGNRVFINLNAKETINSQQYLTVFTLPQGYRPAYEIYTVGVRIGYDTYINLYVNQNGIVGIFSTSAITNGNIAGEISFIIDE